MGLDCRRTDEAAVSDVKAATATPTISTVPSRPFRVMALLLERQKPAGSFPLPQPSPWSPPRRPPYKIRRSTEDRGRGLVHCFLERVPAGNGAAQNACPNRAEEREWASRVSAGVNCWREWGLARSVPWRRSEAAGPRGLAPKA